MEGLQRRPAAAAANARAQQPPPAIHCDVEPAPRPWPGMQMLAIAAVLVLGGLQFLPATHFRHPADPGRNWVPFDPTRHPLDLSGRIEIFSWISCLDLRTLAVLMNSTLSSSSEPHDVYFNFLIPEGGKDKLPFDKITSVLPDSNITVTSQKQIKDKLNVATPEGNFFWSFHNELSSIIIATTRLSKKRYVYISADSVIKGKIEELARIDLGIYAIGAVEDCSKRVGDYTNMDVLNAVHRTIGLASTEPYNKDTCLLDIDVLVVEPRYLKRNTIDAIKVWVKGLSLANPRDGIQLAITLAFYDNYLKLPSSWKRGNANADILNYDGPRNVCSADGRQHQEQGSGETWRQYLSEKSDAMLST